MVVAQRQPRLSALAKHGADILEAGIDVVTISKDNASQFAECNKMEVECNKMELNAGPYRWAAHTQAALRVIVALIFIQHGLAKLIDFPHMENIPKVFSVFGVMAPAFKISAGLIETIGGSLLAVGFLTRPVAFILCGFSAVAYFIVHAPISFFPALNGGEHSVLLCFACLFLSTAGPGFWSLDKSRS
jgi:putative oxidoreductase